MCLMDTGVFGPLGGFSAAMWSSEETPVTTQHCTSLQRVCVRACMCVCVRQETEVSARPMIESANGRHLLQQEDKSF